jgi:hypothetical protein
MPTAVIMPSLLPNQIVVSPSGSDDQPALQAAVEKLAYHGVGGDIILLPTQPYLLKTTWRIPAPLDGGQPINVKAVGQAVLKPFDVDKPPAEGLIRIEWEWGYKIEGCR